MSFTDHVFTDWQLKLKILLTQAFFRVTLQTENNAIMQGRAVVGLALRVPTPLLWKLHWLLVNGAVFWRQGHLIGLKSIALPLGRAYQCSISRGFKEQGLLTGDSCDYECKRRHLKGHPMA